MTKVKSPHHKRDPFNLAVCNAIRHHTGEIERSIKERDEAFEVRDMAIEEKGQLDEESDEYAAAAVQHSNAVEKIEALKKAITFHQGQVSKIVKSADSPDLEFMYDPPAIPEPVAAADEQMHLHGDNAKAESKKKRPAAASGGAGVATGVDQHLAASVHDLDMPEKLKGKCIAAGAEQIGQLAQLIDQNDDIAATLNITTDQAAAVKDAVRKFRDAHRKAMLKKQREEDARPAPGLKLA